MKDLLDKISSYNLFNYLLPGILFAVALEKFTSYRLLQDNLVLGVFVYYFVGLAISRIGSLVVEPVLKNISFLKFADYPKFVAATKFDQKIELLSETNNMYRTLVAMLVVLIVAKAFELFSLRLPVLDSYRSYILITTLLIMFLFSYRKQTVYIKKRVDSTKT